MATCEQNKQDHRKNVMEVPLDEQWLAGKDAALKREAAREVPQLAPPARRHLHVTEFTRRKHYGQLRRKRVGRKRQAQA